MIGATHDQELSRDEFLGKELWQIGLFTNRKLIYAVLVSAALQIMVIYLPFFQTAFHTEPLTLFDWIRTLVISLSAFLMVEFLKLVRQRRSKTATPTKAGASPWCRRSRAKWT